VTLTAILFIAISAFAHALWNLLGKREMPTASFFLVANTLGCLCLAPVLFFNARAALAMPGSAWAFLLLTGSFQALYYASLAGAYRAGQLSIAYPIVRSASVLIVALANVALGRGRQLSSLALAGMVLVAGGILFLPLERFLDFRVKQYFSKSTLFAFAAALGTAGYSLTDDHALRLIRPILDPVSTHTQTTLLYSLFEGLSTSLWLLIFVAGWKENPSGLVHFQGKKLGRAVLTGIAIYFAYTLVLLAMGFARNVSYVVAFRQLSIPIGVALGVLALKEPLHEPKIAGVLSVTAGLVLVAMG